MFTFNIGSSVALCHADFAAIPTLASSLPRVWCKYSVGCSGLSKGLSRTRWFRLNLGQAMKQWALTSTWQWRVERSTSIFACFAALVAKETRCEITREIWRHINQQTISELQPQSAAIHGPTGQLTLPLRRLPAVQWAHPRSHNHRLQAAARLFERTTPCASVMQISHHITSYTMRK